MNLLEKAMRHKAMHKSHAALENRRASFSHIASSHLSAQPVFRKRLVAVAIAAALVGAASVMLFAPARNSGPAETIGEQAAPAPSQSNEQLVTNFVNSWARAWSAKDLNKYLSAYAPEFMPSNGLTRPAWEKQRRQRLKKYRKIEVALADISVAVQGDSATVEFVQSFKADGFSETGVRKRLDLRRHKADWMIVRETSN